MSNALDRARELTGEPAGPGLVEAIRKLPLDRLTNLAEEWVGAADASAPLVSPKPVTEVWPLIHWEGSVLFDFLNGHLIPHASAGSGVLSGGIDLAVAATDDLRGTGAFSDGVVRALLYSHGLVMADPICHAADILLSVPSDLRELPRAGVVSAVAAMSEVSELIDAGIILPFFAGSRPTAAALDVARALNQALARPGTSYDTTRLRGDIEEDLRALLTLTDTGADVESMLQAIAESDLAGNAVAGTAFLLATIKVAGAFDVLSASSAMTTLLFLGATDPLEVARVSQLARTEVPNIGALANRDLLAIRRSSESLQQWRTDLATALDLGDRLFRQGVDSAVIQRGVEEVIADGRAALYREAARSRVFTPRGLVGYVAGTLAGASGGLLAADPVGATVGGGVGLVASLVTAAAGKQGGAGFLDRHYIAFEREPGVANLG